MDTRKHLENTNESLRLRAEKIALRNKPEASFPEAARSLLHELRVHQIELEMQNEELLRIQRMLDATNERYFDLYNLAPVGYFTMSKQGLLLEVNLTFATLLGVDRRTLTGQPLTRFIKSDDQDLHYRHRKRLFEKGEPQVFELRLLKKSGTIFWARLETTVVKNDTELDVCRVVVSDVTDRKQIEEELIGSEARYRALIEQAPEAVLVCNPDTGEVMEANFRFTERFGYDLSRDGPLNLFSLIVDDPQNIRAHLDRIKQTGVLVPQRRKFLHKNGSTLFAERAATLVQFRNHTLFAMTLRDVSEEVRLEQEIQRDAKMATRVQTALLSLPAASCHIEIATIYHPYSYVGGDLYFMDWRYRGQVLRGFLVDAAGHGLSTALHTSAMHVLLRQVNELDLPISDQMTWLNRRTAEYFDEGTFAGALGFELDLKNRQFSWTCAGMPDLWVSTRAFNGAVTHPGMYLGLKTDEVFETHTLPLEVGDAFYVMTDGLTDLLQRNNEHPLGNYEQTISQLKTLAESPDCRDDATAICIRILSFPDATTLQPGWPKIHSFNGYGDYQRLKNEVSHILTEVTGLPHSVQEIAVNEALANAMECRDGVPRPHQARIRFNKIGQHLLVRIKSTRLGFAGNAVLRRLRAHPEDMFSFGEDASMGRGIPIMLSLSHRMTYNSEGTEVLLGWNLESAPPV